MKVSHKYNAIFLIDGNKQFRCFGLERRFSKRLGKYSYSGIGHGEFETIKDAKNYAICKKDLFINHN